MCCTQHASVDAIPTKVAQSLPFRVAFKCADAFQVQAIFEKSKVDMAHPKIPSSPLDLPGQGRCFVCHQGPNLTDDDFHNIGIVDDGRPDPGRRAVTGKQADQGKFKTPALREVARTAPYMHNGRFQTLLEVVQHYNFGGVTDEANDFRDEKLQVLYLVEGQANDLVAFLTEGLTTPRPGRGK